MDRLPTLLPASDARAALPPEILFSASIAHELAHALLQQQAVVDSVEASDAEAGAEADHDALLETLARREIAGWV